MALNQKKRNENHAWQRPLPTLMGGCGRLVGSPALCPSFQSDYITNMKTMWLLHLSPQSAPGLIGPICLISPQSGNYKPHWGRQSFPESGNTGLWLRMRVHSNPHVINLSYFVNVRHSHLIYLLALWRSWTLRFTICLSMTLFSTTWFKQSGVVCICR